ncbi:sensor histidine kinase [Nostoc sp.]|uniref:sensor histidine kinase n=1 Tax=Nostoc sp. TaxID=1180 RepID=UPI002FFA9AD3
MKQQGNRVVIQYSDDGCGIPPENLNKIFEPFFTTPRQQGGSGLGLHIVYNLVTQKLQGTIDVNSAVEKGTLFIVTLPLSTNY